MAFVDSTTGARVIKEGFHPVKITLAAAAKVGDLLGYSSGWKLADMDSSPKVYPELIAGETGASGAVINAFRKAIIDFGSGCTATAGDVVYASTTAGGYGSDTTDQGMAVGVMEDAQVAFIEPQSVFPRINNNRDYNNATGTQTCIQLKPRLTATGTASLNPIEVEAKVASGVAASQILGIKSQITLQGTAAGAVANAICFEAHLSCSSSGIRTITNAFCIQAVNNMTGTVTNGPFIIYAATHGETVAWAGLCWVPDDGALGKYNEDKISSGTKGWIKCRIGAYTGYIIVGTLA